jgi:hypothetical protein
LSAERYVLLGLAPARAAWFGALAQWATSASIAAEFVKCVSGDEVRARLTSGRTYSALIVDATDPSFDRDLVYAATAAATPVIVVRDQRGGLSVTSDLGVAAALPADFDRAALQDVLAAHCRMISRADRLPPALDPTEAPPWLGQLFSVCGPGGTGASTIAIALAQGLAADPRHGRRVVLADLARRGDQAMLHDSVDLGPGLQELVEAHRLGRPGPDEVWRTTFDVPRRGYRLLLGLRRPEAWSALRPRAVDAAVEGLRRSFMVVVGDVTGDVEGEADGGSADVEERNHLARAAVLNSSVVVAVGAPGMKGVHSLAWLVRSLAGAGVAPERILPLINRSPRNPAARAALARTFADLVGESSRGGLGLRGGARGGGGAGGGIGTAAGIGAVATASPVCVPERKLEDVVRDVRPLPAAVVDPVVRAVRAVAERQADRTPAHHGPTRIAPGSLGGWSEQAESGTGGTGGPGT